jgi:hypothetical protein
LLNAYFQRSFNTPLFRPGANLQLYHLFAQQSRQKAVEILWKYVLRVIVAILGWPEKMEVAALEISVNCWDCIGPSLPLQPGKWRFPEDKTSRHQPGK